MAKDTSKFTIKEQDLAAALEISVAKLDKIIEFFESDPDDEWELREGDHYFMSARSTRNESLRSMEHLRSQSTWIQLSQRASGTALLSL